MQCSPSLPTTLTKTPSPVSLPEKAMQVQGDDRRVQDQDGVGGHQGANSRTNGSMMQTGYCRGWLRRHAVGSDRGARPCLPVRHVRVCVCVWWGWEYKMSPSPLCPSSSAPRNYIANVRMTAFVITYGRPESNGALLRLKSRNSSHGPFACKSVFKSFVQEMPNARGTLNAFLTDRLSRMGYLRDKTFGNVF